MNDFDNASSSTPSLLLFVPDGIESLADKLLPLCLPEYHCPKGLVFLEGTIRYHFMKTALDKLRASGIVPKRKLLEPSKPEEARPGKCAKFTALDDYFEKNPDKKVRDLKGGKSASFGDIGRTGITRPAKVQSEEDVQSEEETQLERGLPLKTETKKRPRKRLGNHYTPSNIRYHHMNFNKKPVIEKSSTPAEVCAWYVFRYKSLKRHLPISQPGVVTAQAARYIDPFAIDNLNNFPVETGTRFMESFFGYARKVYEPLGSWFKEPQESEDNISIPRPGEVLWDRKNPRCGGVTEPHIMTPRDMDLVRVNDDRRYHGTIRSEGTRTKMEYRVQSRRFRSRLGW